MGTITLDGDVTGSVAIDGSANVTLTTTVGGLSGSYVDLTTNQTVGGIKTFTGTELVIESASSAILKMNGSLGTNADIQYRNGGTLKGIIRFLLIHKTKKLQ